MEKRYSESHFPEMPGMMPGMWMMPYIQYEMYRMIREIHYTVSEMYEDMHGMRFLT